jgi:hypothetical protein
MPPRFFNLASPTDNSWLSMTCRPAPTLNTIACDFVQLSIRQKSDADVTEAVAKAREEMRAHPEELAAAKVAKMCAEGKKNAASRPEPETPARKMGLAIERARFEALCSCPDEDDACRHEAFAALVEHNERICKVQAYEFDAEFTRAGPHKWVHNPGPTGLCNVVKVIVIESDETGSLWRYTQTRLSADEGELCSVLKDGINVPLRYAWDAQSTMALACSLIEAGL